MPPIQFVVDSRERGKTLAAVLKRRYNLSWSQAKRLVEGRHIRVSNQVETDVARRLKPGKPITIDAGAIELKRARPPGEAPAEKAKGDEGPPRPAHRSGIPKPPAPRDAKVPAARPRPAPLDPDVLVYVDDAVAVVNKPAGLTTMRHAEEAAEFGGRGRFLTRTLAGLLPALLGDPNRRLHAVHRLDRDTSGLVVFARTAAAAQALDVQFRKHATERRYVALTRGAPESGRLESVVVRDRGDGRRGRSHRPNPPDGKRAVTHVKLVEELGPFALVECRLETGRTHQVRIHLGEAGTPLCGERLYDREVNRKPLPDGSGAERPMLHAARLGFRHPTTNEPMAWDAKPPADFAALLAKLRAEAEPPPGANPE